MDRSEKALTYFDSKFNCSQSVLIALSDLTGLSEEESLKVASAFGGGIGRQQLTCGALTGAAMALGLKFGKGKDDPEEFKQHTYELTRTLFDEFTRRHGDTACFRLLEGLNMNDPADSEILASRGLFEKNCRSYVSDAVNLAGKLMTDK
jgi:C_GCAxxG_C_C family probable redox protein